jgi:hypothetical protein
VVKTERKEELEQQAHKQFIMNILLNLWNRFKRSHLYENADLICEKKKLSKTQIVKIVENRTECKIDRFKSIKLTSWNRK